MVARWSREGRTAYEAERDLNYLLFDFYFILFSTSVRGVPVGQEIITHEGTGNCLFPRILVPIHCFCGTAMLWCLFRTYEYRHTADQKKKISTLLGVYTHARHVSVAGGTARDAKRVWRSNRFLLKHGGGGIFSLSSRQFATTVNH